MKTKVAVFLRLGFRNLLWVACYRLALKFGLITKNMKIGSAIGGPFFTGEPLDVDETLATLDLRVFGWINYSKQVPPVWHQSVVTGKQSDVQDLHWSKISDFDLDIGDIKTVWELSRFDWILYFVIEYIKTGDKSHLGTLNEWLVDWSGHNPVNQGVNWKCGQEASFRVMHLCLASLLLQEHRMLSPSIIEMLEQHLSRISPTVLYAMAQDNNHGTSEAVALYIGGLLVEENSESSFAKKWKNQGRFWIENRLKRLVANDGSFSQYSVNYHRVMLDSMSMAEIFRRQFGDDEFSKLAMFKLRKATDWLMVFTDESSGDVPNLGANDGARLMPLSDSDYRDYRPTVQLSSVLFHNKKCYHDDGNYNQPLKLLSLEADKVLASSKTAHLFDDGGYVHMKLGHANVFMHYPRFRFRPSQCDVLHVDFWFMGQNILRDAGSYSYNTEKQWLDYFPSTKAHNTIQFDGTEQMPSLSRFLYGDWLEASVCSGLRSLANVSGFKAGYRGSGGLEHNREIRLSDAELTVIDDARGFKQSAVLRWRLPPGMYDIQAYTIIADTFKLVISANVDIIRFELVEGWESRYYMEKTRLPVLEVEVAKSAEIITRLIWKQFK